MAGWIGGIPSRPSSAAKPPHVPVRLTALRPLVRGAFSLGASVSLTSVSAESGDECTLALRPPYCELSCFKNGRVARLKLCQGSKGAQVQKGAKVQRFTRCEGSQGAKVQKCQGSKVSGCRAKASGVSLSRPGCLVLGATLPSAVMRVRVRRARCLSPFGVRPCVHAAKHAPRNPSTFKPWHHEPWHL